MTETIKRTVWLAPAGLADDAEPGNVKRRLEVVRTQNGVVPRVGDVLCEEEVSALISGGWTVNISQR